MADVTPCWTPRTHQPGVLLHGKWCVTYPDSIVDTDVVPEIAQNRSRLRVLLRGVMLSVRVLYSYISVVTNYRAATWRDANKAETENSLL